MTSMQDILTTVQQGVTAVNNLVQQTNGSLLNISGQLALRTALQFNARDMTLASGNVSYTGVGFRPKLLLLFGSISTNQSMSIGADDGVSPRAYFIIEAAAVWQTTGANALVFTADGANLQQAHVVSFDADGYTLAWTKTGAPAASNGFFTTIAFRS